MRIFTTILPVIALLSAAPASAQTFQPAVVSTNLPPLEALWHLRVALNVAALGCRDADEANTIASYNALIRGQAIELAAANEAINQRYKTQAGAKWEDVRERDMTKLYNYFAQPDAQSRFCAVAKQTLARVATVEARDLPGFAMAAVVALSAVVSPAPGVPAR
jgi:hypothetical protein